MDYSKVLKNDERAVYELRELFGRYGYIRFRTGKFEEYELYARNRDFISADGILTFTDSRGHLMALKPDVTLSIAKNAEVVPGEVQKFYYNDEVYRLAKGSGAFKEITQTGIECIGEIGSYDVCEVISLAIRSLELVSDHYILDISHMGIVRGLTALLDLPEEAENEVLQCIGEKNIHGVAAICRRNEVPDDMIEQVQKLITTYGPIDPVLNQLDHLVRNNMMQRAVDELHVLADALKAQDLDRNVRFDFSVVNDMSYYNGVVFQGFVEGLANSILSGGRYDPLMKKMGKKSGAIGFSISINPLEDLNREEKDTDVDVVMLDRPGEDLSQLNNAVRYLTENGMSVSVQKRIPKHLRYRTLMEIYDGEVRVVDTDN